MTAKTKITLLAKDGKTVVKTVEAENTHPLLEAGVIFLGIGPTRRAYIFQGLRQPFSDGAFFVEAETYEMDAPRAPAEASAAKFAHEYNGNGRHRIVAIDTERITEGDYAGSMNATFIERDGVHYVAFPDSYGDKRITNKVFRLVEEKS